MAISEVQFQPVTGAHSGSFTSDVALLSTLFLWQYAYTTSGAVISTSSPTFDGTAGTGPAAPVKLAEKQSAGSNAVYGVLWMLPPPAGGWPSATGPLATTVTGGTVDSNVGMAIGEFAGLGTAPALDAGASPNPAAAAGVAVQPVSSGSTGAITTSPELILGLSVGFGFAPSKAGAPWTEAQVGGSNFAVAAYQVVTSSGAGYTYDPGDSAGGGWCAACAAVETGSGGTGHTATAALTVTPSFTAAAAQDHARGAALIVRPSFAAVPATAHVRGAALIVRPSFAAVPAGGAARGGSAGRHHHRAGGHGR